MNKVILIGRLTRDPDVRYTQGDNPMCIARYALAVDRKLSADQRQQEHVQTADFIGCVAFGKSGEFVEKYCKKGTKLCVTGHIQTGSYTNRDGQKIYTTDVVVEDQEFAESKNSGRNAGRDAQDDAAAAGYSASHQQSGQTAAGQQGEARQQAQEDGFMNVPDGIDEELPFT